MKFVGGPELGKKSKQSCANNSGDPNDYLASKCLFIFLIETSYFGSSKCFEDRWLMEPSSVTKALCGFLCFCKLN